MIRRLLMLLPLLLAGCAGLPFPEPVLRPLAPTPATLAATRHDASPACFTADVTILVQLRWRQFAAIGCSRVDRRAGTFELLAMNHMGFKIFHVAGDRQAVQVLFAMPAFADPPEFLQAVAEDVRDMYLDLAPPASASAIVDDDTISYQALVPGGQWEYTFGGEGPRLLRKRFYPGWRWRRQIRYFEHEDRDGVVFPRGIVGDNRQFNYRLIIKHRHWTVPTATGGSDPRE